METKNQKSFKYSVARLPGESMSQHLVRQRAFNDAARHIPPEKMLADLLKRQARQIMTDVTECPADTIPAHLGRLNCLCEIITHHLRYTFEQTPEAKPSGQQLQSPYTLADYLECLRITRETHRAPAWVSSADEAFETINRKLDTIAGLLAQPGVIEKLLREEEL